MPRKKASPSIPASAAALATRTSKAQAPARKRQSPSAAISPKALPPRRITIPSTPPSRTIRFEPSPMVVTGTSGGRFFRK